MKIVSKEMLDYIRRNGIACIIDAGFGPYHIYEMICDMLKVDPLQRDSDDWVNDYVGKIDILEALLDEELPEDIVFWINETGDYLLTTYENYIVNNLDTDDVIDAIQSVENIIEDIVELEKQSIIEDVERGEYKYLFEKKETFPTDYEIVAYTDYYNHSNENTLDSACVYAGEIEVEIEKARFCKTRQTIIDLILKDEIRSSVCMKDNGDSILVYDTFYLYQYAQRV